MSVPSAVSSISYDGNNSTVTAYTVPFKFFAASHLTVVVTDEDGVETELALTTGFTATGAGVDAGGALLTVAAVPVTSTISIKRNTPMTNPYDWSDLAAWTAATLENNFDWLTMAAMDSNRRASEAEARALRVPSPDTVDELTTAQRSGKFVGFNDDGELALKTADEILAESAGGLDLSIGTVITGPVGTDAEASISGTAPAKVLNLVLPGGAPGEVQGNGLGISAPTNFLSNLFSGRTFANDEEARDAGLMTGDVYWTGGQLRGVLLPLAASSALATYKAAVEAASGALTPAAESRIGQAFAILTDGGILDELVDGAYYGTDGNTSVDEPISLRGVTADEIGGTITRDEFGAVWATNDGVIAHAIADTKVGTFCIDYANDGSAIAFGTPAYLCPTASGSTSAALQLAQNSSALLALWVKNATMVTASSQMAEGSIKRFIWSRNQDRNRFITTYGASTSAQYVNGIDSTVSPDTDIEYTDATAIERVVIGGALGGSPTTWQPLFKGRIASWLLFSRALTADEARVADRAMQVLDGRARVWVAEGDSTVAALNITARATAHWPAQLALETGWGTVRFSNIASNGNAAAGYLANVTNQGQYTRPRDAAPVGYYSISGDINGIGGGTSTAAESYADIMAVVTAVAALGFKTVVLTMAVPDWSVTFPSYFAIANQLNTLIREGYDEGDFDYLIDVDLLVPNHNAPYDVYWEDTTHLNASGNALIAADIATQIPNP